ncbi:phosphoribosylformylglycinamidine synthase subunit PurS [Serpentinicella sp. ANB-PHB4]|uniref:phosphoribosylformylglycinamidine synthase subunit PurS n=1 Tax=Serpentinicella sp. ANB-PHB4 TaxID=3074076 RepID=UPI00285666CE|nr:phosphoribosylformylglycinamidine synthase subunit PurS [Serpentinicella sp. ANB-PHB4]MDR5658590.1 phosphoribosylformylglycinamidine synthase subunit PurS [Serpentinicella sp. ANB-PHB4]
MKANVYVTLKNSIADPQGFAIKGALNKMGYESVEDVRIGKLIEVELGNVTKEEAEKQLNVMCEKLLANTVIEKYRFELVE